MDKETKQMIREIHQAVVKSNPASDELTQAARNVITSLDDHLEWSDLKQAIADLDSVLSRTDQQ